MLVSFVFTVILLLGFCGLVLDVGVLELTQIKAQNAADAAALGAMQSLKSGSDKTTWQMAGKADAALNGFTDNASSTIVQVDSPATGVYASNPLAVQATVNQQVQPIFFPDLRTVSATAIAVAPITACTYLMSNVFTQQLSFDSVNEAVTTDCSIYLGNGYALSSSSGGQFYVNAQSGSSSGSVSPTPLFNIPRQSDPLSYLAAPAVGSCTSTNLTVTSNSTLHPGTYCGGLTINNNARVSFKAGTYIILGNLSITNATLSNDASGISFYMTGNTTYPSGVIKLADDAFTLSASNSGSLAGILFFSDRSLASGQTMIDIESNDPNSTLDGIIYLPGQEVLASATPMQGKSYFSIVADYFNLHNVQLAFRSNYASLPGGSPFHPTGGGLVQ